MLSATGGEVIDAQHPSGRSSLRGGDLLARRTGDVGIDVGPDDCYGVAWTLLHIIETGPNPVLTTEPGPDANEWHQRLYDRAVFGGLGP
ncbi:hypothetical protein ABZ153_40335 [Streptomyces sp. NPDC006290]|uniref:hypothetical protein n=1 Tax=Streptomyces sp. NPDC006290 TaxID=3156745 RepID=UPI0033B86662